VGLHPGYCSFNLAFKEARRAASTRRIDKLVADLSPVPPLKLRFGP
jgi:hypothetical protein